MKKVTEIKANTIAELAKKVTEIKANTIAESAKKDLDNYRKGNYSFELNNWLRDEMILNQVNGIHTLRMDTRTLGRCRQALASIRQRIGTMMTISVNDTKECLVSFDLDLTLLTNSQRERLNREYDLNIELSTEEIIDKTYEHMIG